MGKVPVVVDRGSPVSELGAIAIYLSDRYSNAKLSPSLEGEQRAAYLKWVFFSSAIMEPAFTQKMYKWEAPAISIAWGSFDQMFAVLSEAVSKSKWLLGDSFSSADILVGSNLRVGQMLGIIPKEGPVADYVSRLQGRDSFVQASAIEERESARFPVCAD